MAYDWLSADIAPLGIMYVVSFIALFIGSITDLKTREVPDWLNFGLIGSGIGLNLLFSAIYSDTSFIINSLVGLAIFFGIAYVMFYAGQWGGGDSKILMGLGAAIGIDVGDIRHQFLPGFFINALFAGAIYGLLWSVFLVFRNRKKFQKEFAELLSDKNVVKWKKVLLAALVIMLASSFLIEAGYIKILVLSVSFLVLASFYMWIFVRAIEKSCMYRLVEPSRLTEGDWIVKDIYVGKQYICGPKDLGISKNQIRKLIKFHRQKKIKKILIKEGIPFVPSFFIAFVLTLTVGNPVAMLL